MHWIVAYDISADPNRARVARRLEREGVRVQKSVFLLEAAQKKVRRILTDLTSLIDAETDQIAAFPLRDVWLGNLQTTGAPLGPIHQQSVIW